MFKFYSDASLVDREIIGNPKAMFDNNTIQSDIMMSLDFRYLIYDMEGFAMHNNYVFVTQYHDISSTKRVC